MQVRVDQAYIPWRGFRTWYRAVGPRSTISQPLVVLHGGPGTPHDYLESLEPLANQRKVVFYDQLGCGRSDRPDAPHLWTMDLFVDELAAVRTTLNLDQLHIFGHSWGGMLALEYALRRPAGLLSLILANCIASRAFVTPPREESLYPHEGHCCLRNPPDCLLRSRAGQGHQVREVLSGNDPSGGGGALGAWDVTGRLNEIETPTLVLTGRYDKVPVEATMRLQKGISRSRLVVLDGCHFVHLEQTEIALGEVAKFLRVADAELLA